MKKKEARSLLCCTENIVFLSTTFLGCQVLLPLQALCFINLLQFCWNRNQLPEDILRVNGPKFPVTEQFSRPQCRVAAPSQDEAVAVCEEMQQLQSWVNPGRRHCRSCTSL